MTAPGHDHGASPASDGAAAGMRGGLVEFATRRRVTIAMCTVTLLLFGLIALGNLKVNLLPDLSYPTLTVRTEYTGAAPTEIETLITQPVEEAVGVVKNLRKLKSVSRTGQSDVVLEFAWGTNMDQASLEVRDKMEALNLPLEAKAPVLLRFNPSTEPIMRLVLSNKTAPTSDADAVRELTGLRRYADEDLKKKLEPVTGVAAVKVGGGLEDEIQVDIDQQKLAQLNLPIDTVIKRLKDENINISGGRLEEGSQRFLVRTVNQFADLEEIRNLLVTTQAANGSAADSALQQMFNIAASTGSAAAIAAASAAQSASSGGGSSVVANGVPVRLKDVATVRQGYKEREAIIRLGGRESVELAIYKEGDANTVSTAEALRKRLEQIKGTFPSDVELTTIEDQSRFIEHAIADVKKDAVIGGLLAILIIFLFLRDGWSTFVISLSLPVSIIATFFFMGQLGLSLNVMSLGGLALATGLVVDDSIVVLESIAKARERGLGILQAAIAGTREVSMAVVASTLTTIAVFLPLVFVDGIAGQLFRDQALTVAIAIAISLLVSMTLIPMLSSLKGRPPLAFPEEAPNAAWQPQKRWQKPVALGRRGVVASVRWSFYALAWLVVRLWRGMVAVVGPVMRKASDLAMKPYAGAERGYLRLLPGALAHPGKVLGVAAIIFVATMALVPMLGADLIPQLAQDFRNDGEAAGRHAAQADRCAGARAAAGARQGRRRGLAVWRKRQRHPAGCQPDRKRREHRQADLVMEGGGNAHTEAAITERLRGTMSQHPGAQVDFARPALFSFSTPLEIELRGQDMATLEVAGQRLAAMLRGNAHYADVKSTVEEGFPEIQIRFDQERAGALGLTTRQIADVVVKKVRGDVATRYSFRDRKIDVLVRAQEGDRASVESIRRLIVNPGSTRPVTLDAVADVVATTGPSEIHRADQTRVAVVSANLRDIDLGAAMREVQQMVAEQPLGAGVGLHIGGQGEELAQAAKSLIFAFGLAIFLVYLVMASQFESLLHPFVILFTIPLALVGAILALMLTGKPISVVVFIGLILLVGLVTKNAIILIDKVNQLREAGVAKHEALVEGARSRLRPIIMTTLCTLFGFLPLAVAMGEGAEVRAPMAITVIGGLLVSTLLTLLVIPVVYDLMDRRGDAYYRERGRKHAGEGLHGDEGGVAGGEEPA